MASAQTRVKRRTLRATALWAGTSRNLSNRLAASRNPSDSRVGVRISDRNGFLLYAVVVVKPEVDEQATLVPNGAKIRSELSTILRFNLRLRL